MRPAQALSSATPAASWKLRCVPPTSTSPPPPPAPEALYDLQPVRGYDGIREATLHVGEHELNVAVVYGTANARTLIERMKNGGKQYHFIEVMACPGGCIGGDGQPKDLLKDADQIRQSRISGLYARDASLTVRKSHENPDIKLVYEQFYGQPLSKMAEKMLHTTYTDRSNTLHVRGEHIMKKWKCKVCGYIYEGESLPADFTCPICKQPASAFEPHVRRLRKDR